MTWAQWLDHDPLCPQVAHTPPLTWCLCEHSANVRADERNRMTLPEWAQVVADARASAEAEVRERIAQEIEAEWAHFMRVTRTDQHHWIGRVYADAARIARNGGAK
jgi:hypothetical protein